MDKPQRPLSRAFWLVIVLDVAMAALLWYLIPVLRRPMDVLLIATMVMGIVTAIVGGRLIRNMALVVISIAACLLAVEMGQKYFRIINIGTASTVMAGTSGPYPWQISDGASYVAARNAAIANGDYPAPVHERYAGDIFAGRENELALRGVIHQGDTTKLMDGLYKLRDESVPTGMVLTPNNVIRHHSFVTETGETLFDGKYTINDHGFRHTAGPEDAESTVIFFGCSQTFGFGLNDDETMAHYFAEAGGFTERVLNISVPNSGPHQALRELEIEYQLGKAGVKPESVRAVIYTFLYGHPNRVVRSPYRYAPFYHLVNGEAEHAGAYREASRRFRLDTLLNRSRAYPVLEQLVNNNNPSSYKWRLTHAIFRRMDAICRERYNVGLTVVCMSDMPTVADTFKRDGIRVLNIGDAFGDAWEDKTIRYKLYDGHTSAYGNYLLGNMIYQALEAR